MKKVFHQENAEVDRFNPDVSSGLNTSQVEYMRDHNQINVNKSYLQIVLHNIFTFFNVLMFIVAAILLLVVGPKVVTNLMFLVIILFNLLIGTIQECKSKHIVEKLKLLNDSKNTVRRNGENIQNVAAVSEL